MISKDIMRGFLQENQRMILSFRSAHAKEGEKRAPTHDRGGRDPDSLSEKRDGKEQEKSSANMK
jgi:hypothetical protein